MGTKNFNSATDLITFTRASGGTALRKISYGDQADGTLQLWNHSNNVPRIEYDATGAVKGLLIEEARTNLLPTSTAIESWNKLNVNTSSSTVTSPSGNQDAVLVKPNSGTPPYTFIWYTTQFNTGVITSISVFAKASGKDFMTMCNSSANTNYASFNLSTGVVSNVTANYTANIEDYGNGWYRCSVITPTGFNDRAIFAVADANNTTVSVANGEDGILLYGAQLETGAFPTSYIPTTGSTATRAADVTTLPTSAFGYNQKAGTVLVEFKSNKPLNEQSGAFNLSDGTPNNRIIHYTTSQFHRGFVRNTSGTQADIRSFFYRGATSELVKFAMAFAENDFATSANGASVDTDTSGTVPSGISVLGIGYFYPNLPSSNLINGHIKSIKYYPRRLTNTQLQELTT